MTFIIGLLIVAFGIIDGCQEDHAFYQRQRDYYALDSLRETVGAALQTQIDSLLTLSLAAQEAGDTLTEELLALQIDSIEVTEDYQTLVAQKPPPQGFSLAYVITIICVIIGLPFIFVGLVLIILWVARRKDAKKRPLQDYTNYNV
ncbi:MAG: hypothetical protein IJ786_03445 [Bacteroidaceae bacterium]|nr:hypothetical protein [Bacteroidaceae bacterium]